MVMGHKGSGFMLLIGMMLTLVFIAGCGSSKSSPEYGEFVEPNLNALARNFRGPNFVLGWESTFGGSLGGGFDSVGETIIQHACIDFDKLTSGSVTTNYTYSVYTSVEDLATSMNASYSASAKFGIYQSSQKAEMMASLTKKSNTVYAHVRYQIKGPSTTLYNVALKDEYASKSVHDVVQACGDYYIGNISSGAILEAIVSIETSSRQEKADAKYELSQKLGPAKTDIKARASLEHYLSQRDAKVHVVARGCTAMPPVSGTGQEMTYFYTVQQKFYDDVTKCLANDPTVSMADEITFFTLENYKSGIYELYKNSQDEVEQLLKTRFKYELLLADMQDIIDHPVFYDFTDGHYTLVQIQDLAQHVPDLISYIDHALNICQHVPLDCVYDLSDEDDPLLIRAQLPPHLDVYPASCDEIYRYNLATTDGDYRIYLGSDPTRALDVYCILEDGGPRTYLTLTGYDPVSDPHLATFYNNPTQTYSQKIGWWDHRTKQHAPDQVSFFEKVRILPKTNSVTVVISDNQFAQTWTNPIDPTQIKNPPGKQSYMYFVPFGYAMGARANTKQAAERYPYQAKEITAAKWQSYTSKTGYPDGGWGRARVDLTGTKLAFSLNTVWLPEGYEAQGTMSFSPDRKIATIYGRGSTGYMLPYVIDSVKGTKARELELIYTGN